jgi:hypothetical protein
VKKHVNLFTVLVIALAVASIVARMKGIELPISKPFGFSDGG